MILKCFMNKKRGIHLFAAITDASLLVYASKCFEHLEMSGFAHGMDHSSSFQVWKKGGN